MSLLEARLNVTLARLRVIEEALHGDHHWTMNFVGPDTNIHILVDVKVLDSGVQFVAKVPAHVPYTVVQLEMSGEVVLSAVESEPSLDRPHLYLWGLDLENLLSVV
jgi:hypothetical protein